jgi:hypothetical protein
MFGTEPQDPTFTGFRNLVEQAKTVDSNMFLFSSTLWKKMQCGAWPYNGRPLKRMPVDSTLLIVTADYDLK